MMAKLLLIAGIVAFLISPPIHAADWPWWRGPHRNGVAEVDAGVPTDFSQDTLKWAVDLPGRSHGSACVLGGNVFLAVADVAEQTQSIHCFDRQSGALKWKTPIHTGGFVEGGNQKASFASGTPACDGERVYINFLNRGAVHTTALDLNGKQVWQTKITDYVLHQGYGSSPAVYQNLVLVSADNKGGGAVCGLDRSSGEIVWKVERPAIPNYASPIVLEVAGKTQLLLIGTKKISSFDPLTGATNWEIDGATEECVTSTPTDGTHIFSSGGYPRNHVSAVVADGSGKIAWEINDRVYVPSMFVSNGHLYAVTDGGIALCWDSATGEEKWKTRLGGSFSSSPVLANDSFYAVNEAGEMFVVEATPEEPEIRGPQKIADEVLATPSVCGNEVFLRVAFYDGENRSEKLVCYQGN